MGQALRRADFECGLLNDAKFFDVPLEVWLSDEYHASLATILKRSRPKAGVDLTQHVLLTDSRRPDHGLSVYVRCAGQLLLDSGL